MTENEAQLSHAYTEPLQKLRIPGHPSHTQARAHSPIFRMFQCPYDGGGSMDILTFNDLSVPRHRSYRFGPDQLHLSSIPVESMQTLSSATRKELKLYWRDHYCDFPGRFCALLNNDPSEVVQCGSPLELPLLCPQCSILNSASHSSHSLCRSLVRRCC